MLHKEFEEQIRADKQLMLFALSENDKLRELGRREGIHAIELDTEDSFRIRMENESFYEH